MEDRVSDSRPESGQWEVSTGSASDTEDRRTSLTPEKDKSSSSGRESPASGRQTPASGRQTPRKIFSFPDIGDGNQLKRKIRHLSGKREKYEGAPPLSPLSLRSWTSFVKYVEQHNFSASDVSKCPSLYSLDRDSVVQDCPDQKCALHLAAESGNPVLVESLLSLGHSALRRTTKGYTPLHLAVFRSHRSAVKKLLCCDESVVNLQTCQGYSPLHIAVMTQNHDAIRMIREKKGSDFGLKDVNKETAFHLAARLYRKACLGIVQEETLNEELLEVLEKIEAIINYLIASIKEQELVASLQLDDSLTSPLHHFADLDCFSFIRSVCHKFSGENEVFEVKNCEGLTAFLICVGKVLQQGEKVHMDTDMTIIETSLKKQKKQPRLGRFLSLTDSPLVCARLLLEKMTTASVDLTHPTVHHMTALQIVLKSVEQNFVSSEPERDLVNLLLQKGACVHVSCHVEAGEAPIHIVNSQNFDEQMMFLFIEHLTAETINRQDDQGETVLHYAVSQMDEEKMERMLRQGANVMVRARNTDRGDIEWTVPNMKTSGPLHRRTALMVALKQSHGLPTACNAYFAAISRVGLEHVVSNVETADLLEFFGTHISASAFTKNNQFLREICQSLSRGECFQRLTSYSGLERPDILYRAVHYLEPRHFEKTFHKTALAWTNENDDPISASDLLHFEYQTHSTKNEGLHCLKNQLTNDKLLYWVTRTFSKFYPTPSYILWTTAIISSVLQLGLSYFFYVFDIVSDYQLTQDYGEALRNADNYTLEMWNCSHIAGDNHTYAGLGTCFQHADRYPSTTYTVAYWLTITSMFISVAVYIIGIVFFFDSKNLTSRNSWFTESRHGVCGTVLKYGAMAAIRVFWPVFHLYRRVRYEASQNKSSRRKNLLDFEIIWAMVKTIEYGIEATVQLIIVLYLLVPFYDQIHNWDFQVTMQKTFNGIAHFLTGGWFSACLLEKVVGKLFINVMVQSVSLTTLRYLKYGMSILEHLANMWPLFLSNLIQIVARILVLRVFFVTAEDILPVGSKALAITLFFTFHFLFTLLIKITFEVHSRDFRRVSWLGLQLFVRFLINLISSAIVYTWSLASHGREPRTHVHEHNTFLPQLLFQSLVLCEHLLLVLPPLWLPSTSCLDWHTFWWTAVIVPCLWLLSLLCLCLHYKNFHTWAHTNGPSLTCWGAGGQVTRQVSCVTGVCCSPHLFRVILDADTCLRAENISNVTEEFKMTARGKIIEVNGDNGKCQPLLR